MNRLTTVAGSLLCFLLAMPAGALPMLDSLPTMDTLRNRLELTPEQEQKLAPLLDKRVAELRETQSLLEQATSDQQKNDVLRDAKKAGDDFNHQVESLLTPSQQHEWREIRSDLREQAKERAEEKSEAR